MIRNNFHPQSTETIALIAITRGEGLWAGSPGNQHTGGYLWGRLSTCAHRGPKGRTGFASAGSLPDRIRHSHYICSLNDSSDLTSIYQMLSCVLSGCLLSLFSTINLGGAADLDIQNMSLRNMWFTHEKRHFPDVSWLFLAMISPVGLIGMRNT